MGDELITEFEEEDTVTPISMLRNHIYINGEINDTSSNILIESLYRKASSIISTCLKVGTLPCPIELHINSIGGNVSNALEIIQSIKNIQSGESFKIGNINIPLDVNTHIEGEADSSGSLIALVGTKRTITKYSSSIIHKPFVTIANSGTAEDVGVLAENLKKIEDIVKNIYIQHSKLDIDKVSEIMKNDTSSTPEQLLEYGIVDEII